jgi:hypothetical protein
MSRRSEAREQSPLQCQCVNLLKNTVSTLKFSTHSCFYSAKRARVQLQQQGNTFVPLCTVSVAAFANNISGMLLVVCCFISPQTLPSSSSASHRLFRAEESS